VVSTERGCYPDEGVGGLYPPAPAGAPFKWLNSGSFMGKVKDVRRMLQVGRAFYY
jgi:hypothetical protein